MTSKIVFAFITALVLASGALATQASARPYHSGYSQGFGGYSDAGRGGFVSSAGFGGGR